VGALAAATWCATASTVHVTSRAAIRARAVDRWVEVIATGGSARLHSRSAHGRRGALRFVESRTCLMRLELERVLVLHPLEADLAGENRLVERKHVGFKCAL